MTRDYFSWNLINALRSVSSNISAYINEPSIAWLVKKTDRITAKRGTVDTPELHEWTIRFPCKDSKVMANIRLALDTRTGLDQ